MENSKEVRAKMGARWANPGQSWRQVATEMGYDTPKMAHDSGKIAILGKVSGVVMGAFCIDSGTWAKHLNS